MSLLPFQPRDEVRYGEQRGVVIEVKGERVVVMRDDGIVHIASEAELRVLHASVSRRIMS